jgi:hypothetical protein
MFSFETIHARLMHMAVLAVQVNVLTSVVRDAAWGVSTKVVALQHVVIDVDGTPIGVGDGKDRVVQCV